MLRHQDNITRVNIWFEDVYDLKVNLSYNDSNDFVSVMGHSEACHPYLFTLNTLYTPLVIVIGLVGNLLSFLVLSTTHLKMRSSSYYLAALAVSDFGFLVVVLVVTCSFHDIFELFIKDGFCQIFVFIGSSCAFLSVWLTVAFTTERFIAVRYPLRRQYMCTISRARTIVLCLTFAALLSQIHVFWQTVGLIVHQDRKECSVKHEYVSVSNVTNYLDTFFTFIIPVVLIIFMNVVIAKVVFRSHNMGLQDAERSSCDGVRFHPVGSQSSNSTRNSDQDCSASLRMIKYDDCTLRRNRQARSTSLQVQNNINKMMLLISSFFVALNFPSYMLRILIYFWNRELPEYLWCAQQFAQLLYYTNFSINFLLYAMCGKSFRLCLRKMFFRIFDPCIVGLHKLRSIF